MVKLHGYYQVSLLVLSFSHVSAPRKTVRDIMREEVEKEEETSSFSVPKVDKSWKDLDDWRPGEVMPS